MRWTWLLVLLIVLAPSVAFACPVCGTAPERSREAYINMTALMTFLPLAVIGALVFVVVRRLRALDALERQSVAEGVEASRSSAPRDAGGT